MKRWLVLIVIFLPAMVSTLPAQQQIQRGTVKKLNIDRKSIVLIVDKQERTLVLADDLRGPEGNRAPLKERLRDIREGADVQFRVRERDGRAEVDALRLAPSSRPGPADAPTAVDLAKLVPLPELGLRSYEGFAGGLYPHGKNDRPESHEAAGQRLARDVRPRDAEGKPAADGKIVLLSVGMSNTSQASQGFQRALRNESGISPRLVFVNGAQGGMTAAAIRNADDGGRGKQYWNVVDERLEAAGATRAQVQVVWIKQADAGPTQGFPRYAQTLQAELADIVRLLKTRFPEVRLCYLSCRTYGGHAKTRLNPEPYAYESGFSVKWLIERQIDGDPELNFDPAQGPVAAPWLSWGPYTWANGSQGTSDTIPSAAGDFTANDGTHESPSGQEKMGRLLLHFFKNDSTTRSWFLAATES